MVTHNSPSRLLVFLGASCLLLAARGDDDEVGLGLGAWQHNLPLPGGFGVLGNGLGGGLGPVYMNRMMGLRGGPAMATAVGTKDDSDEQTGVAGTVYGPGVSQWWSGSLLPGYQSPALQAMLNRRTNGFMQARPGLVLGGGDDDSKEIEAGAVGAGGVMWQGLAAANGRPGILTVRGSGVAGAAMSQDDSKEAGVHVPVVPPIGVGVGGVGVGVGGSLSMGGGSIGGAGLPEHDSSEEVAGGAAGSNWNWDWKVLDPAETYFWGGMRWGLGAGIGAGGPDSPGYLPWIPMPPGGPSDTDSAIPAWLLAWLLGGGRQNIPPWLFLYLNGTLPQGNGGSVAQYIVPPFVKILLKGTLPPGGWKPENFPGLTLPPWFLPLLNGQVPSGWKDGSFPGLNIPPWLLQWLVKNFPPNGSGRTTLPWLLQLLNGRLPVGMAQPPWFLSLSQGVVPPAWLKGSFPGLKLSPVLVQRLLQAYPPNGSGRSVLPWLLLVLEGLQGPGGTGGYVPPWLLAWILRTFPPQGPRNPIPPWLLPLLNGTLPALPASPGDSGPWSSPWIWLLLSGMGGDFEFPNMEGLPWWLMFPPWISGPNEPGFNFTKQPGKAVRCSMPRLT